MVRAPFFRARNAQKRFSGAESGALETFEKEKCNKRDFPKEMGVKIGGRGFECLLSGAKRPKKGSALAKAPL